MESRDREPANGRPGATGEDIRGLARAPWIAWRSPLWSAVDAILALTIVGMLVTVTLQVVSRVLGDALGWTEEVTRYLFLWGIFLGMASGFRSADHIRITFVLRRLPQAARRFAVHAYALVSVSFFVVVAYYGAGLALKQYESNQSSPILEIGMYLVTLAIAVSAVLAVIALVQSVYFSPGVRESLERGEVVLGE